MVTQEELSVNRDRLILWQREQHAKPGDGRPRLHLGCGKVLMEGYVNCDLHEPGADKAVDLRQLPYQDGEVGEIVCQHALEHVPYHNIEPTLREWFRALAPGGTVELGMPDLELCLRGFIDSDEFQRWGYWIDTIYGYAEQLGMAHQGGMTLSKLVETMTEIGYEVLEAYNYDANGCAPSVFVYARKALAPVAESVWEQDVILGTFTHRTDYLPALAASVKQYAPGIPFVSVVHEGKINQNMERLRQVFLKSGKRFWTFMDDDITLLAPNTIRDAVRDLVTNRWAGVGVYSTFDPHWIDAGYRTEGLKTRETPWLTGYFVMVDSLLVDDIAPDMELPDGNTSVDTSYSTAIRARGYHLGLSANVVYHTRKAGSWVNQAVIQPTNEYLMKKWGPLYFEIAQYDGNVIDEGWQEVKR